MQFIGISGSKQTEMIFDRIASKDQPKKKRGYPPKDDNHFLALAR